MKEYPLIKGGRTLEQKREKGYVKYAWVGNRICDADMSALYHMKKENKKPISQMVADAVAGYVSAFCETEEGKKSGLVA